MCTADTGIKINPSSRANRPQSGQHGVHQQRTQTQGPPADGNADGTGPRWGSSGRALAPGWAVHRGLPSMGEEAFWWSRGRPATGPGSEVMSG